MSEVDLEKRLKRFMSLTCVQRDEYQLFRRRAMDIQQQMKDEEFRITVVGEFSAGKSTFLNALIGRDVLPHANSETTASVTYIKNTHVTDKKCNTIEITFFNSERAPVIYDLKNDPMLLRNYATTMSKTMNVVEEVESITIHLDFFYTDDPIVFIDTPGLNGMAEGHYERMLYEIQRSHTSIYLFPVRGVSKSNQQLYELLKQYQSSFIFVMNFIDELNIAEGENVESKIEDFRSNLKVLGIKEQVPVFGISALQALAARDKQMKYIYAGDTTELTEEDRITLLEKSRFSILEDYLWNEIIAKEKDRVRQENYERKYDEMVIDLANELDYMIELHSTELDTREKDRVELRIKQLKETKTPNKKRLNDFLLARQRELRKLLQEDVQVQLKNIQDEVDGKINELQWKDFESGEQLKEIERVVGKNIVQLTLEKNNELTELFISTYQSAILRVNHYFPTIEIEQKDIRFRIQLGDFDPSAINGLKGKVEQRKQETKKLTQQEEGHYEKLQIVQQKLGAEEGQLNKQKKELHAVEDKRNRAFRAIGVRPAVKVKVETYQKEIKKKKMFGGIRKLFGGESYSYSYENRTREVKDDSDARAWENKKENVEKEYSQKSSRLLRTITQLEKRYDKMNEKSLSSQESYEKIVKRLKNAQEELKHTEREYKDVYSKHKVVYVQQQKLIMNQTTRTILEDVENHLEKNISIAVTEGIQEMIPNVNEFYNETYELYLNNLRTLYMKTNVNESAEQVKELMQWKEKLKNLGEENIK